MSTIAPLVERLRMQCSATFEERTMYKIELARLKVVAHVYLSRLCFSHGTYNDNARHIYIAANNFYFK